jgi:hypothetical protein
MSTPDTNSDGEETDDEQVAEAIYPSRGPGREDMVNGYLPESEDWEAKSVIDLSDPAAIAALSNFDSMFPEVDDLQPMIDDFLHHYLKSKTSVNGSSRQEYKEIFQAMFGQSGDGDGESTAMKLVAADED